MADTGTPGRRASSGPTDSTPLMMSPRGKGLENVRYDSTSSESDFAYAWDYMLTESEEKTSPSKHPLHHTVKRGPVKVSMRRKVWRWLETNPQINFFFLSMIALSTVAFCLETVHSLRHWRPYFYTLETVSVIVFSGEYVVRFATAPMPTLKFVFAPMNMLDFFAIGPFYLHYIYLVYEFFFGNIENPVLNLTTLRCLRLARIFKFGRYSTELSLVTSAFLRSSASFVMLSFMLGIALVVFSTLMYLAEQGVWNDELGCYARSHYEIEGDFLDKECSPFSSIPKTFWWAVTTMTTVGYGDTYPVTSTGKVVAASAMIVGILSVALPTTVLGVQFGDSYQAIQDERERLKIMQSIPTDDEKHDELMMQIQMFSEMRQEIADLRKKIDSGSMKLVNEDERPEFSTEISWFGDTMENAGQYLEAWLRSVETPVTAREKKQSDRKNAKSSGDSREAVATGAAGGAARNLDKQL